MRAFIAIDLPDALRSILRQKQSAFRAACPHAQWTRPEGIHLTLKFLGEISDAQVDRVTESLARLERFDPFPIEVKGFGFFPDAQRPRVFWAGLELTPGLTQLATSVEALMAPLEFPKEHRPFTPHLTLARFKEPRSQPALSELLRGEPESPLAKFEVSEFFLFESKLSPRGAEYRKVARFPR
jgi:RNA 2',3'-cyclic 3'-phosphodiesterase